MLSKPLASDISEAYLPVRNQTKGNIHFHDENINRTDKLDAIRHYFKIDDLRNEIQDVRDGFEDCILESLYCSRNCMLPCFNTTVGDLIEPTGSVVVIDIGGSNMRIGVVEFLKNKAVQCKVNKSWNIHSSNKHFNRGFFEWVTNHFNEVIDMADDDLRNSNGKLKVGITWSFPIIQDKSANNGIVSDLGKGFSISDEFRGKDLKYIFESSFERAGIFIEVCSIVNDSASVLVAGSYFNNSKVALVQGTGVNSSFLIDSSYLSADKCTVPDNPLIINAEASFLGHHLSKYVTPADIELNELWKRIDDEKLDPPHMTTAYGVFQPLELLTAGRYIPELVRLVGKRCGLFHPSLPPFDESYSLTGEDLISLYGKDTPIKLITDVVIERASIVLVAYLETLLKVLGVDSSKATEVSVVGSMLQYFPGYRNRVEQLLPANVSLSFIQDSSIYGAAISACVNEARSVSL